MGYAQIAVTITEQDLAAWNFTRPVTQAEETEFFKAEPQLQQLGFDVERKENWMRLWNAFDKSPQTPINVANIVETAKVHRDAFIFRTAVQQEYDQLSAKFPNQADRDFIARSLKNAGYETDDEQSLLTNWNLYAQAHLARGYHQVDTATFNRVLGNLQNSPQAYKLIRKAQQPTKKFDAQAAVKAQEESRKNFQRDESELIVTHMGEHPDSIVRPLTGALKAHRDSVHAAMEAAAKKEPQSDSYLPSYWEVRVKEFLAWIPENVIRMELEPQFNQPRDGSWMKTYRDLEIAYERRKYRPF